jgi:hypothetical protein
MNPPRARPSASFGSSFEEEDDASACIVGCGVAFSGSSAFSQFWRHPSSPNCGLKRLGLSTSSSRSCNEGQNESNVPLFDFQFAPAAQPRQPLHPFGFQRVSLSNFLISSLPASFTLVASRKVNEYPCTASNGSHGNASTGFLHLLLMDFPL